jgi:hypothetical protein
MKAQPFPIWNATLESKTYAVSKFYLLYIFIFFIVGNEFTFI